MSGGIFVCRADAPYGSHPSGRAVQPRPLRGISDGRSIACLSRFGRIGRTWENEGDGTTTRCRCRELSVSTLLTLSVWAGMPIRTTDQSALTDGLRLAGSGQRFRPKGHRAIANMFCWLATRVALLWEMTHLCRNPQTVVRGSTRRFPVIRAKGCSARASSMALPAAPCCPWEDFPMQRYEAAVGWPRYSLPTG